MSVVDRIPIWIGFLAAASSLRPSSIEASDATADAKSIVTAQLASLNDPTALLASLPDDTVLLVNGRFAVANGPNAAALIASLLPGLSFETVLTRSNIGQIGDTQWISADALVLHSPPTHRNSKNRVGLRILELVVTDRGVRRIAALSIASTSGTTALGDELGTPTTSPLTQLLASPRKLDGALLDNANTTVVVGANGHIGELGVGRDDSQRVLAPWLKRDMKVATAVEVDGERWGYVAAHLSSVDEHVGPSSRSSVDVILIGVRDTGRWQVAAIQAFESESSRPDRVPTEVTLESRSIAP